jgi:hypothetical protein
MNVWLFREANKKNPKCSKRKKLADRDSFAVLFFAFHAPTLTKKNLSMWAFIVHVAYATAVVSAWRPTPPCMSAQERWTFRQDLDMLSRFTGHDQCDKWTKRWIRQQALQYTVLLGRNEKVTDVRLMDGDRLAVLSDKRRWEVDLLTRQAVAQHKLRLDGKHHLSLDGQRLYHVYYKPSMNCHVIQCDGTPVLTTDTFPYHVTESLDKRTTCVGLCSQNVIVAKLDASGVAQNVERRLLNDVALASVGFGDKVFHGLMGGKVGVWDTVTGSTFTHALRRLEGKEVPSVRSLDVEMLGSNYACYTGGHDGAVRVCRFDASGEVADISTRVLHRCPVTRIRCHSHRVASGDDEGHVVVTDMHGTLTMYNILVDGPGDVQIDLNQRFLVVGRGNTIHVWDHDEYGVVPLAGGRRPSRNKRGGGGRRILAK